MKITSGALLVALCSALLALSWPGGLLPAAAAAPAAVQYSCPMHPSFIQDHLGDCPACGMKLVPVKPPEAAPGPAAAPAGGAMRIGAGKQQILGIGVTPVQRSAGARALRVLGRVAVDEARLYKLNAGMGGSVRDVAPVAAGSRVRKGQVLGSFYAPDALSMMQLFIVNTQGYDRIKMGKTKADGTPSGEGHGEDNVAGVRRGAGLQQSNIQQRVMQLENLGVSEEQREEMTRTGLIPETVKLVSPADGVVLARGVYPGLKFDRGFEFFRIADLRRVWVLADVFLQDAGHVRVGMGAEVSIPEQRVTLPGRVTEILPQFDAATRTLKVKVALDNPGFVLRPDMFVDVALRVALPDGVVVPSDAVVDSGLSKRVFVQTAEGVFEPRAVETGWRSGDQVEVVTGLRPGELVVSSGTFFLDSETRMRSPTSGAAAANGSMPAPSGHRPPGGAGASTEAQAGAARAEAVPARAGDGR
jgi:Cu(I)/Ag(I) efflux system membrane fusion protein